MKYKGVYMAENKKVTFFTDEKGLPSSTRLTGFITSISLIAVVIMNIIYRSDWKLALVVCALVLVVALVVWFVLLLV